MKLKSLFGVVILAVALVVTACGGSSSTSSSPVKSSPLDLQGNWHFVVTDSEGVPATITFAGELFELVPPVVTSNSMLIFQPNGQPCIGDMIVGGQASGTDSIVLTATLQNNPQVSSMALTGTIASDQQHMSGAWTSSTQTCGVINLTGPGTWSAILITPVTGTWSGTMTGQPGTKTIGTLSVAFILTEDTLQTSRTMGQLTGQITIAGSSCFNSSVPVILEPQSGGGGSLHVGLAVILSNTVPDATGAVIQASGQTSDVTSTSLTLNSFQIIGGACDGQNFTGTFTKQ